MTSHPKWRGKRWDDLHGKVECEEDSKPEMYGDGAGLYLNVAAAGKKNWLLRVTIKGQSARREIGLGGVGGIDTRSQAEARVKASAFRAKAKAGRDPKSTRDKRKLTLRETAIAKHNSLMPTFRNEKHRAEWLSSLNNHVLPKIGDHNVADIKCQDVFGPRRRR